MDRRASLVPLLRKLRRDSLVPTSKHVGVGIVQIALCIVITLMWLQVFMSAGYFDRFSRFSKFTKSPCTLDLRMDELEAPTVQEPDLYNMPGYLWSEEWWKARWIPYTSLRTPNTKAPLPATREPRSAPSKEALQAAPPSYMTMLQDFNGRLSNPDLDFLRNKSVLLYGCSLDRSALHTFCHYSKGSFTARDDVDVHTCTFDDLGLRFSLWFHYGALWDAGSENAGGPANFEERLADDFFFERARKLDLDTSFDLILWASGTWDIFGLVKKYRLAMGENWNSAMIGYDELEWYRGRLYEMASHLRSVFPTTPVMFRPVTYISHKGLEDTHNGFVIGLTHDDIEPINKSIYLMQQSAIALMKDIEMPVFRWAEKLIGSSYYMDPIHYELGSPQNWLYGEMMLYYLKRFTAGSANARGLWPVSRGDPGTGKPSLSWDSIIDATGLKRHRMKDPNGLRRNQQ